MTTQSGELLIDYAANRTEFRSPVEQLGIWASERLVGVYRQSTRGVGLQQDSLVVARLRSDGGIDAVLATVPYAYRHWGPHELPGGHARAAVPLPVAFSGVTSVGVGATAVHIGLPEAFSVLRVDHEGLRGVTRVPFTPSSVTDEHREKLFRHATTARMAAEELALLSGIRGRGTLPPFGHSQLSARVGEPGFVVTSAGETWLRPFTWLDTTATSWIRFDEDGWYRGTVTLPARFTLMAIRDDVVLGVTWEDDDVESVQSWRIVESG